MPGRAARVCGRPATSGGYCTVIVRDRQPCAVHGPGGWRRARQGDTPEQRKLRLYRLDPGSDGYETHCWRCRRLGLPDDQLGHVVAVADGGRTTPENCHREHRQCNLDAGRALGRQRQKERAACR